LQILNFHLSKEYDELLEFQLYKSLLVMP
jgi:hypothetical protein